MAGKMLIQSYDFIIVGSGSSGAVLANRLSSNPKFQVALVEAGPSDLKNPLISTPGKWNKIIQNQKSKIMWPKLISEQEQYADNQKFFYPRGKVLGGTSSINGMIYIRGNKWDYENWKDMGNNEWSYEEVLKYFKKSERNYINFKQSQHSQLNGNENIQNQEIDYHSTEGELIVSNNQQSSYIHGISQDFLQAAQNCGHLENQDFNGENQEGVGIYPKNIHEGQRVSASTAFLQTNVKYRPNLHILTGLQANKINMIGNTAHSVQCMGESGQHIRLECEKEIILSAGVFNSPKLLMLSGIGRKQDLQKNQIKCINDLQGVGQNLMEHPQIFQRCTLKSQNKSPFSFTISNIFKKISQNNAYKRYKKGIYTSNLTEVGGFINLNNNDSQQKNLPPQIQLLHVPFLLPHFPQEHIYGNGFSISASLLRPKSKGQVQLCSRNPSDPVKFSFNFLKEEQDLQDIKKGLKKVYEILQQEPLKQQIKSNLDIPDQNKLDDDQFLEQFIKKAVQPTYHGCGTLKMGQDDNESVVDQNLKIHNILNMRVCDASVLPEIISGNTNAVCLMIAEKLADKILTQYQ